MSANHNSPVNASCTDSGHFSGWYPLEETIIDEVLVSAPGAVQVRVAEGLVDYPLGKSAMVYFFFAATDARDALLQIFEDELKYPGARGRGPLWFRFLQEPDAQARLEARWTEFVARFGTPPLWHGE